MDNNYINNLQTNLLNINKSAKILLSDLKNLKNVINNIENYSDKGFKLNNIIENIDINIHDTEEYLLKILEDIKQKSLSIKHEVNNINTSNNIFIKKNNDEINSDNDDDDKNKNCCCI